jgi:hypothetical protein
MGSRSKAPTLFLYGLLSHDVLQDVCDRPSSAELLAGVSVMKLRTSGYNFPLGPKVEKAPVPVGYMELEKAVDGLGKDMFPTDWTGEERGYFKTGSFDQKFRSKIEYETHSAFRDAVLYAQCELECDLRGETRNGCTHNGKPLWMMMGRISWRATHRRYRQIKLKRSKSSSPLGLLRQKRRGAGAKKLKTYFSDNFSGLV